MNKPFQLLLLGLATICFSCSSSSESTQVQSSPTALNGLWHASIVLGGGEVLPFEFEVQNVGEKQLLYIMNDTEKIAVEDIKFSGDSVHIGLHIFNTVIHAKINEDGLLGTWVKNDYDDYVLPFSASRQQASTKLSEPMTDVSGKWQVAFDGENGEEEVAVGVFRQQGQLLTGTFLTPTGDYRYLSGYVDGDDFQLSCFDGEHAFLFKGTVSADTIRDGHFWSGKSWHQTWKAVRNENAALPDASSLTYLKEGYDGIEFSFPNLEGKQVSLKDDRFKGKVVLVQLMGSWCPNCMDETAFLSPYYKEHQGEGLEMVALAFERNPEMEKAKPRLEKLRKRFDISYELLIAGNNDKEEAAKKLPMLNHVMSFPTTIFIDRKGVVRKIHTGFSGPGTGVYYEQFVEDFKLFMEKLLAEEA